MIYIKIEIITDWWNDVDCPLLWRRALYETCLADLTLACNATFLIFTKNILVSHFLFFIYHYLVNDLTCFDFFFFKTSWSVIRSVIRSGLVRSGLVRSGLVRSDLSFVDAAPNSKPSSLTTCFRQADIKPWIRIFWHWRHSSLLHWASDYGNINGCIRARLLTCYRANTVTQQISRVYYWTYET